MRTPSPDDGRRASADQARVLMANAKHSFLWEAKRRCLRIHPGTFLSQDKVLALAVPPAQQAPNECWVGADSLLPHGALFGTCEHAPALNNRLPLTLSDSPCALSRPVISDRTNSRASPPIPQRSSRLAADPVASIHGCSFCGEISDAVGAPVHQQEGPTARCPFNGMDCQVQRHLHATWHAP